MEQTYTVLADGSVCWLSCPADYIEAATINRDELGNVNEPDH